MYIADSDQPLHIWLVWVRRQGIYDEKDHVAFPRRDERRNLRIAPERTGEEAAHSQAGCVDDSATSRARRDECTRLKHGAMCLDELDDGIFLAVVRNDRHCGRCPAGGGHPVIKSRNAEL